MKWSYILSAFLLLALGIIVVSCSRNNMVLEEDAVARFAEFAETSPENVEVIRHTSNWWLFGDPFDVTFELKVNGRHMSGRCTEGLFQPLVCRMYDQFSLPESSG